MITRKNARTALSTVGFCIGFISELLNGTRLFVDQVATGLVSALVFLAATSFYLWFTREDKIETKDESVFEAPTPEGAYLVKFCKICKSRVYDPFDKCFECKSTDLIRKFVQIDHKAEFDAPDYFPELKTCPMCAQMIKFEAKKCHHCRSLV
jgi:hypothetical protein